jgi:hypothetical protein
LSSAELSKASIFTSAGFTDSSSPVGVA